MNLTLPRRTASGYPRLPTFLHTLPELFLFAVLFLEGEHLVFGAPGTFPFLAFDFGDAFRLFALFPEDLRLEPPNQDPSGPIPVQGLRALLLAFDREARGKVLEDDAGGNFIDVLAAGSSRAHKGFFQIGFVDPEPFHGALKAFIFMRRNRKDYLGDCLHANLFPSDGVRLLRLLVSREDPDRGRNRDRF